MPMFVGLRWRVQDQIDLTHEGRHSPTDLGRLVSEIYRTLQAAAARGNGGRRLPAPAAIYGKRASSFLLCDDLMAASMIFITASACAGGTGASASPRIAAPSR